MSRTRRASIALALVGVLAVQSGAAGQARQMHRVAGASPVRVNFILSWLPNVQFAGLWVAQQKGWFRQAGIDMSFKGWAPGVMPETDVPARGGNTFGFQSGAAVIIARSKGVPIRVVYAGTQRSVFGLTVLARSHITSLRQLKGKRVGYKSHEFYVPATMLACAGLKPTDWKPVQVSFDTGVLTSGHVDADPTFLINEPIALALQGVQTHSFPAADHCFHFYDVVLFTTDGLIKGNPALVKRVVSAVARGFAWAHQHPVAAARLTVAKYFPAAKGASASLNLRQQTMESREFVQFCRDARGQFTGLMTPGYWQDSVDTLYRYQQISTKPGVQSLFTNAFNPNRQP